MSFMGNSFNICCSCSSHGWCWFDGRCRFSFLFLYDGRGWFSPLQLPLYSCHRIYGHSWNMKGNVTLTYGHGWNMKGNVALTFVLVACIMMDVFSLVMTHISLWLFGCVGAISWVSHTFFFYSSCMDKDSLYHVSMILS